MENYLFLLDGGWCVWQEALEVGDEKLIQYIFLHNASMTPLNSNVQLLKSLTATQEIKKLQWSMNTHKLKLELKSLTKNTRGRSQDPTLGRWLTETTHQQTVQSIRSFCVSCVVETHSWRHCLLLGKQVFEMFIFYTDL